MQLTGASAALLILSLGSSATAAFTTRQSQSCTYYCPNYGTVWSLSYVQYDAGTLECMDEFGHYCLYSLADGSSYGGSVNAMCEATAPTVCAPASGVSSGCTYSCPPSNSNYQAGDGETQGNVLICETYDEVPYYGRSGTCLYSTVDGSLIGAPGAVGACTTSATASCPPQVASGWSVAYACAVDSQSTRILANPEYYQTTTNTPLSCTTLCGSRGFSLAAVEYADECFCSNSYSGPVTAANASDCDMACTGDSTETCGAGNRAQIFTNPLTPAAVAALPSA